MEDSNQKKVKHIMIFLITFVVVFFIVFLIKKPPGISTYNGFTVQKIDNNHMTLVYLNNQGPYKLNTVHSPQQVEDIEVDFNIRDFIVGKKTLYTAIDPYDKRLTGDTVVAALELNNVIEAFFQIPVLSAFMKEKGDYLVKDCLGEDPTEGIFVLRLGNQTKILKRNNCIILEAEKQEDLIKEADALAFRSIDIIQ